MLYTNLTAAQISTPWNTVRACANRLPEVAARILKAYEGQPGLLYGPAHNESRRAILESITGKKVARANAGVTNVREALFLLCPVYGHCHAIRLAWLRIWIMRYH